jgi:hypothetical protein
MKIEDVIKDLSKRLESYEEDGYKIEVIKTMVWTDVVHIVIGLSKEAKKK